MEQVFFWSAPLINILTDGTQKGKVLTNLAELTGYLPEKN